MIKLDYDYIYYNINSIRFQPAQIKQKPNKYALLERLLKYLQLYSVYLKYERTFLTRYAGGNVHDSKFKDTTTIQAN